MDSSGGEYIQKSNGEIFQIRDSYKTYNDDGDIDNSWLK
jgi:hypothetical protein